MNSGHEEFRAEHEQRTVETVMNLFRASTLLSRIGGRLAQQVGLASAQQWTLLAAIAEKEGISLKELRRNILVTKQNISSMMDRLRQAGYVRTYEDRADRRVTRVELTAAGHEVLHSLRPLYVESNRHTFDIFNAEEQKAFAGLLDRLVEHLNRQEESLEASGFSLHKEEEKD